MNRAASIHPAARETMFHGLFSALEWPFNMTLSRCLTAANFRARLTPARLFFLAG